MAIMTPEMLDEALNHLKKTGEYYWSYDKEMPPISVKLYKATFDEYWNLSIFNPAIKDDIAYAASGMVDVIRLALEGMHLKLVAKTANGPELILAGNAILNAFNRPQVD
jgi:hypothetical protein